MSSLKIEHGKTNHRQYSPKTKHYAAFQFICNKLNQMAIHLDLELHEDLITLRSSPSFIVNRFAVARAVWANKVIPVQILPLHITMMEISWYFCCFVSQRRLFSHIYLNDNIKVIKYNLSSFILTLYIFLFLFFFSTFRETLHYWNDTYCQ